MISIFILKTFWKKKNKKKKKKYFKIKEIKTSLKGKTKNLIISRNYVDQELSKEKVFKNNREEYFFYLNLLIEDETNKILLKKYLRFLKDNEKELEKENIIHEGFDKELIYYSIFFEKEEVYDLFGKKIK